MKDNRLQRPQQLLQELISNKIVRGVYSERQLQEVMTDFWFNHFNVYWDKGSGPLAHDGLRNERDPAARSRQVQRPAAGNGGEPGDALLSGQPSVVVSRTYACRPPFATGKQANAKRKPGINENYARELMELHTLGVDGGYTQKDVTEVARAFTGWTIDQPRMRAISSSVRRCTIGEKRSFSASAFPPIGEFRMASRSSTFSRTIRARRASSRRSWFAVSSATIRRSPLSTRSPQPTRRPMAIFAKCCARFSIRTNSCRRMRTGRR